MDFNFDFQFGKQVIGVDEVGRGSWAGPVIACAALLDYQKSIDRRLDDSKKLSHKIRKEILYTLSKNSMFGIGEVSNMGKSKYNPLGLSPVQVDEINQIMNIIKNLISDGIQRGDISKLVHLMGEMAEHMPELQG